MSADPPRTWPLEAEPPEEQMRRARRIAAITGQTVEQVLADAIKVGVSKQYVEILRGPTTPARGRH